MWLVVKENKDFDEDLLDECCSISSQVLITYTDTSLFGDIRSYQSLLFLQTQPVNYIFGEAPTHLVRNNPDLTYDGRIQSNEERDVIRHICLGEAPNKPVRVCSRCNSKSLPCNDMDESAHWVRRWQRSCVCGGQWKLKHQQAKKKMFNIL